MQHSSKILEEARSTVEERGDNYDHPYHNHVRIAKIWSVILHTEVTPAQAALCMAGLKIAREAYKHSRDNMVDLAGYASCVQQINDYREPESILRPQCKAFVWNSHHKGYEQCLNLTEGQYQAWCPSCSELFNG